MVARTAVIIAGIVLLALIAAGALIWSLRNKSRDNARKHGYAMRGDLNRDEERALMQKLAEAEQILRNLGRNDDSNWSMDPEVIRSDTKIAVGLWLRDFDKIKEKVNK